MKIIFLIASLIFIANSAFADIVDQLGNFVGYTIVASLKITGYQDENGKKSDSFEGCNFGRIIIFDNNKILTCAGYGYQYAYRPSALILSNGTSFKMLVGDNVYDMQR